MRYHERPEDPLDKHDKHPHITGHRSETMVGASSLRQHPTVGGEVYSKDLIPHEDVQLHISEQLAYERP